MKLLPDPNRRHSRRERPVRRYDFHSAPFGSDFVYKKMGPNDLALYRQYDIKIWNNNTLSDEVILEQSYWTISRDGSMILDARGGGITIDVPELYYFIWHGNRISLESGGYGKYGSSFRFNEDGTPSVRRKLRAFLVPELLEYRDEIFACIAEAFVVSYSQNGKIPFGTYSVIIK